jgi:DNA-binding IclR family transcriptional regulator
LQLFSQEHPRLSVPEVARMADMTQSAARRFLLTLVHDDFAQTDGRYYWLTAKTLRIGQAYVDSAVLPRMLRPIVEQVARTTQEHVSVGVRDGDDIVHGAQPLQPHHFDVDSPGFEGADVLHRQRSAVAGEPCRRGACRLFRAIGHGPSRLTP